MYCISVCNRQGTAEVAASLICMPVVNRWAQGVVALRHRGMKVSLLCRGWTQASVTSCAPGLPGTCHADSLYLSKDSLTCLIDHFNAYVIRLLLTICLFVNEKYLDTQQQRT